MWYVKQMKTHLRRPQKGLFGWFVTQYLTKRNGFLEENAVRLSNIKPDHHVLEIGFGPGIGLESAYKIIKDGDGKLYGIESSFYMVETASKRLHQALTDKKLMLFHGCASSIPLNTDSVHRVFHCNSYYFWPSMRPVLREIYRVMKPGGVMVTTLCIDNLKKSQKNGFLNKGIADPVKYMVCLENFGFENVHIEYQKDPITGKEFQAIFSEVIEKPAHDKSMFSDDEDDEIEQEVERLFHTGNKNILET
ncbi:demethylmenaquinone methyltransferase [Biomphalaria pfeifferi]|uniref:Demethylmenaquinone methyltransferase n=1 Tax=Biomphalaria pfeifferi TaxID=112525 RepID=A0AAD8AU01_BIOPF|nr:demethylmenaquinone methyltransferase [Biomphalaria pfeifferi]